MSSTAKSKPNWEPPPQPLNDLPADVRERLAPCIQCGTCSASCPNAFAMDLMPRKLWRMVQEGMEEEIFESRTFTLCSACYYCTLRCPRGLPLTEAMEALKRVAARKKLKRHRRSTLFYEAFLESVRRHGRVREMEFMNLYFTALKHPLIPLRFLPLGMKLLLKGKIHLELPSRGKAPLDSLFKKCAEQEEVLKNSGNTGCHTEETA